MPIIIIGFIALFVVVSIIAIDNDKIKRRNAIIDMAYVTIEKAEKEDTFAGVMYYIEYFNKALKKYRRFEADAVKHPNKYHQFPFEADPERFNIHFQWILRNTIEKMEKKAMGDISKYHNSDEYKAEVYYQFVRSTEDYIKHFDSKTLTMLQDAKNNIAFRAGILHQYQPAQESNNSISNVERTYYFDSLDGIAFEQYCASVLEKNGFYDVTRTPSSGDQGVDIIATKDGIRYAIQCKCYSSDLGNTPVQEVATGKNIYNCHVGVVLTNRYFTEGAKVAAKATGTLLWDRDKLISMFKD